MYVRQVNSVGDWAVWLCGWVGVYM